MRAFAAAIMKGRAQAIAVVSALAVAALLLPLLSPLSAAALALVALRKGAGESGIVLVCSAFLFAVFGLMTPAGWPLSISYVTLVWLPVWVVALLLRESGKLNLTLEVGGILGTLAVVAMYALYRDPSQLWNERIQVILEPLLSRDTSEIDAERVGQTVALVSRYLTGGLAAGSVASLFVSLFLARGWQAMLYNPGGLGSEFLGLRLHSLPTYLVLALLAVAFTAGTTTSEVAWNMLLPLAIVYVVVGFAILHNVIPANRSHRFLLAGIYILVFFIPHALVPLALLGLSDNWLDWRRKLTLGRSG